MENEQAQYTGERSAEQDSTGATVSPREALRQRLDSFTKKERSDDSATDQTGDREDDQSTDEEGDQLTDENQNSADNAERSEDDQDDGDNEQSTATELALDAESVYLIDGEEISGEELREQRMLKADHTRKAQEMAEQRKEYETERETYANTLAFFDTANTQALQQYQAINWQELAGTDAVQFQQKQKEFQQLMQRQNQLNGAKQQFIKRLQAQQLAEKKKQAKAAMEELSIKLPGWNNQMYQDIGKTATEYGISAEEFDGYTDPRIMHILHDAMQFRRAGAEAKKATQRKPKPQPRQAENRDNRLTTERARQMNLQKKAKHGDKAANRALLKDRLGKAFGQK